MPIPIIKCLTWLLLSVQIVLGSNWRSEDSVNEASRDNSDVWLVIIMCLLFCFALRHANDFYNGETITLVREGEYGRRFCRRVKNKRLQQIENDFNDMIKKLCEKQDKELDEEGCCGYYEEKRGTRLYI